jgi:hypothetical protein
VSRFSSAVSLSFAGPAAAEAGLEAVAAFELVAVAVAGVLLVLVAAGGAVAAGGDAAA